MISNAIAAAKREAASLLQYEIYSRSNGIAIETRFSRGEIDARAVSIVAEIRALLAYLDDATGFYVFTSLLDRMVTTKSAKAWASKASIVGPQSEGVQLVNRGKNSLVCYAGGSHCTSKQLIDGGWRVVQLGDELRNPVNMNALEKRVHQRLDKDARKLWRVCGAGGVRLREAADATGRPACNVFAIGVVLGPCGLGTAYAAGPPTRKR